MCGFGLKKTPDCLQLLLTKGRQFAVILTILSVSWIPNVSPVALSVGRFHTGNRPGGAVPGKPDTQSRVSPFLRSPFSCGIKRP